MRIRWTTPAAEDLEQIFTYLRSNSPTQAVPAISDDVIEILHIWHASRDWQ